MPQNHFGTVTSDPWGQRHRHHHILDDVDLAIDARGLDHDVELDDLALAHGLDHQALAREQPADRLPDQAGEGPATGLAGVLALAVVVA